MHLHVHLQYNTILYIPRALTIIVISALYKLVIKFVSQYISYGITVHIGACMSVVVKHKDSLRLAYDHFVLYRCNSKAFIWGFEEVNSSKYVPFWIAPRCPVNHYQSAAEQA